MIKNRTRSRKQSGPIIYPTSELGRVMQLWVAHSRNTRSQREARRRPAAGVMMSAATESLDSKALFKCLHNRCYLDCSLIGTYTPEHFTSVKSVVSCHVTTCRQPWMFWHIWPHQNKSLKQTRAVLIIRAHAANFPFQHTFCTVAIRRQRPDSYFF